MASNTLIKVGQYWCYTDGEDIQYPIRLKVLSGPNPWTIQYETPDGSSIHNAPREIEASDLEILFKCYTTVSKNDIIKWELIQSQ